jgi:hypothetical protein
MLLNLRFAGNIFCVSQRVHACTSLTPFSDSRVQFPLAVILRGYPDEVKN